MAVPRIPLLGRGAPYGPDIFKIALCTCVSAHACGPQVRVPVKACAARTKGIRTSKLASLRSSGWLDQVHPLSLAPCVSTREVLRVLQARPISRLTISVQILRFLVTV